MSLKNKKNENIEKEIERKERGYDKLNLVTQASFGRDQIKEVVYAKEEALFYRNNWIEAINFAGDLDDENLVLKEKVKIKQEHIEKCLDKIGKFNEKEKEELEELFKKEEEERDKRIKLPSMNRKRITSLLKRAHNWNTEEYEYIQTLHNLEALPLELTNG